MGTKDDTDEEKKALFGGVTAEQRADMTDEELAGIDGEEGNDDDEGTDADADAGEGDGDKGDKPDADGDDADGDKDDDSDDDGDKDADEDADKPDAGADADETGDDAGGDDADDDDEEDEEDPLDVTRSVMPNEWQLPKDADDQLKTLKDQRAELAAKFDGGDLSATEYHQQREALDDDIFKRQMQINDAQKAWGKALSDWSNRTVRAFLREHPEYDAGKNETRNAMLDAEVRRLQSNSADPFNPRVLRKAHANIQKAFGNSAAPSDKPGKTVAKPKEKTPVVPGKKPQVPPTLARVPQDEIEDTEGGKFARLDRLSTRDPHAFEEAMLRMSAKDRAAYDEYLAGA